MSYTVAVVRRKSLNVTVQTEEDAQKIAKLINTAGLYRARVRPASEGEVPLSPQYLPRILESIEKRANKG